MKIRIAVLLIMLIFPALAQDDNGTIQFFDGSPLIDAPPQSYVNKDVYPVYFDVRVMGNAMAEEDALASKILSFFGNNSTNGFNFTPPLTIA